MESGSFSFSLARQLKEKLDEHEYWVKNRTRMINRLHGMFTRAGVTDMRKTALKSKSTLIGFANCFLKKKDKKV